MRNNKEIFNEYDSIYNQYAHLDTSSQSGRAGLILEQRMLVLKWVLDEDQPSLVLSGQAIELAADLL